MFYGGLKDYIKRKFKGLQRIYPQQLLGLVNELRRNHLCFSTQIQPSWTRAGFHRSFSQKTGAVWWRLFGKYFNFPVFPVFHCKLILELTPVSYLHVIWVILWLCYVFSQIGHIEGQPDRKGVFPMSFVHNLCDWQPQRQVWSRRLAAQTPPNFWGHTGDSGRS